MKPAILGRLKTITLNWLPVGILVFGIFLRLREFLYNRSLSFDEALLALNIVNRGYRGLLRPLDNYQGAPLGFLLVEKFVIKLFGNSDLVLRIFPWLCGLASLGLFYLFAKRYLNPRAFALAIILFAISDNVIFYSAEVKQYSTDVFIAVLILFFSAYIIEHEFSTVLTFIYALLGCISIWFSHPAVFMLAGAGITLLISSALHHDKLRFFQVLMISALWGISFVGDYFISLHNLSTNSNLLGYWQADLATFPPKSFADVLWVIGHLINIFKDPLGFTLPGLAAIPFLLGCLHAFRCRRDLLLLLVAPVVFLLVASLVGVYPLGGRLVLFLAAPVFYLTGEGAFSIELGKFRLWEKYLPGFLLAGLLLLYPMISLRSMLASPPAIEESRSAISYAHSHWSPTDIVYVYAGAIPTFQYYADQFGFSNKEFILGVSARKEPEKYIQDISRLVNRPRVWVLFSHVYSNEDQIILTYLNSVGTVIDQSVFPGASVYLYNLSPRSE